MIKINQHIVLCEPVNNRVLVAARLPPAKDKTLKGKTRPLYKQTQFDYHCPNKYIPSRPYFQKLSNEIRGKCVWKAQLGQVTPFECLDLPISGPLLMVHPTNCPNSAQVPTFTARTFCMLNNLESRFSFSFCVCNLNCADASQILALMT